MSEDFDTFESTPLVVGNETLIHAPGGVNVIGVVMAVDAERRAVTFADGRAYVFPPAVDAEEAGQ